MKVSIVYHNKNKYTFFHDTKFQIYQYLKNGLIHFNSAVTDNAWGYSQMVLVKNGKPVVILRHEDGILAEVVFCYTQLNSIFKTQAQKRTEYSVTYGHALTFQIDRFGSKNHESTRIVNYKEKSFRYYDKCFNIYQRFLKEKIDAVN
jgi:hypothetical protein